MARHGPADQHISNGIPGVGEEPGLDVGSGGGGGGSKDNILGVPEGYIAHRPPSHTVLGPSHTRTMWGGVPMRRPMVDFGSSVPAQYKESDLFKPSYEMSEELRAKLQLTMRAAGLFGKNQKFRLGKWDEPTRAAWKKLLVYANGAGMEWGDALRDIAESNAELEGLSDELGLDGEGEGGEEQPQLRLTNPADIRRVVDNSARAVVGRRLKPHELDAMVSLYHERERGEFNQTVGGQQEIVSAPSLDTFAQEEVRRRDPTGALEMDTLGQLGEFGELLRSTGGAMGGGFGELGGR